MQFGSVKAVSDADAKHCGYIAIRGTESVEIASNPQNLINWGTVTTTLTVMAGSQLQIL